MKTRCIVAVALCVCLSQAATATTTWHVAPPPLGSDLNPGSQDQPFATIQKGIDSASESDTVIVAEGTYVENIMFWGKNIVLTSTDPLNPDVVAKTIIDGDQSGSVVTFLGFENETCVLSGFTIRNGKASYGGGIYAQIFATGATIQGNIITSNSAEHGGGIYNCGGIISNNVITGNSARLGGGLAYCHDIVQNNTITANSASCDGGGLSDCDGTIQNNTIYANSAGSDGGGLSDCDATIHNNTIYANSADHGGGLWDCDGTIQNNAIYANSAGSGGGLYDCSGTIQNNTIYGNSARESGGGLTAGGPILNCVIWGNGAPEDPQLSSVVEATYSCIQSWAGGGEGNIAFSPHLVDPEGGDFHLRSWSPCIDAGDPSSDFSNEPEPNGGRINMGAYGNTPEAASKSPDTDADELPDDWEMHLFGDLAQGPADDPDGDFRSNLLEYLWGWDPTVGVGKAWHVDGSVESSGDGTSWEKAFKTMQEGIDAATDGDTVIVAPATYVENIQFNGKNIVLASTDPLDPDVVAKTIIEGDQSGSVVTFSGTEDEICLFSGFTVRNGGTGILGGTEETHSGAAIQNNVISDNDGGGIRRCDGTIQNNVITGNSREEGDGGGLAFCGGTIQNNVITENSARFGGGLAYCHGIVQNNTITANSSSGDGGGLYDCQGTIRNCIVWGNAPARPQLYDSATPTYCCIEGWAGTLQGNIGYHPYFVGADNGDFHLRSWSPCIDAGDPSSDFSNEPQPNGGRINVGAYGNTPEAASKSPDTDADELPDDWEMDLFGDLAQGADDDPDGDFRSNLLEYLWGWDPTVGVGKAWHVDGSVESSGDGTSWEKAFKTIQEGISTATDGDMVVVAQWTYHENIRFNGKNIALASTDPLNSEVVAKTVIDGKQAGSVVTFSGSESQACILSGFTLVNGRAGCAGGGIRGNDTKATIQNNIITRCSAVVGMGCGYSYGGGLFACNGAIENNVISRNSASTGGGLSDCDGTIQNNTIYANSAGSGGGLHDCNGSIRNCIIWGNGAPEDPQVSSVVEATYSCIHNWTGGGEGNIAFSPYFVDPEGGDFHLRSWSPCVDAGDPSSDFSNEPEPNGGRVNMGAYGNTAEAASKSPDTDADELPDDWEMHWFEGLHEGAISDPDGDHIYNRTEYRYGWIPVEAAETLLHNVSKGEGGMWYQSIQPALCEADDGDEIVVYPGVHEENIEFGGRNVILRSTDPSDADVVANTILDGGQSGSVVTFSGTEDETCILSGFIIRNGNAQSGGGICGGTEQTHTHATIQNNVVSANSAPRDGGGLAYCDGRIQNNTIMDNSAGSGGGLYRCHGTIQNNTISGNSAEGHGGGLAYCNGTIQSNLITRNSAEEWYGGGLAECNGTIHNNTIYGNSAGKYGGGLAWCHGTIQNNTVYGTSAGEYGGGLYRCNHAISNCIVWGNEAPEGPELWECVEPSYSCIQDWMADGQGNIAFSPHLVDPEGGDFHLRSWSPCIDAGDPTSDFSNEPEPNGGE